MTPVHIFIGSSSNGEDAVSEAVYEWSLRKNIKPGRELVIHWMRQTHDPDSHWYGFDTHLWPTPFSGYRWAIPEYCAKHGIEKAIYTDEDMVNLRDIGDLYDIDLGNKAFGARRGTRFGGHEFCVMLINVPVALNYLIPVERQRVIANYHQRCIFSYSGNANVVMDLDPRWNVLDGENLMPAEMFQLHWTKMASQPWKPAWFTGVGEKHVRPDLVEWFEDLQKQAAEDGYRPENYIPNDKFGPYNIIGR